MGEDAPPRMGIEIDGASCLLEEDGSGSRSDEGRAVRMLSLEIARRLCASSWGDDDEDEGESSDVSKRRSVAVYFNSVEQSLLASRELRRSKEGEEDDSRDGDILIHSLGHDSLPPSMVKTKSQRNQKQSDRRIILVVKPTDCDTDSLVRIRENDPGQRPVIRAGVIDHLQSLLFQASASSIPAVVLSPRLSELSPLQAAEADVNRRTGPMGFEQSGYQDSATYGGLEPPVGPTSWLLRDLGEMALLGESFGLVNVAFSCLT